MAGHGQPPGDAGFVLAPEAAAGEPESPARRRRGRRILVGSAVAVLVLVLLAAAGVYSLTERIGDNVTRVPDVFGGIGGERPAVTEALTFLLMGTDSRSAEPTTGTDAPAGVDAGSQRSDVIMLVRFAPNRTEATVISVPRDSWVNIPGHGMNKVNAAYAFGGPSLLIQTVEAMTGVRIDHFAVIDFAGFTSMVDSVGGIDVRVAAATANDGVTFHAGLNHLDGRQALAYVRQRYDLPRGDLDRAQRQQNAVRALLDKAVRNGALSDPVGLYELVDATSRTVSVDDTVSNAELRALALELRGLRPSGVVFLSAPVRSSGRQGAQSVVYLDDIRAAELWAAVRDGNVTEFVRHSPSDLLASTPA